MKLEVVLVDNTELSFQVSKETIIIGRSPQCDVVIPHEGMSRKHCQITYKDGDLYIEDLGSVNGVFIDGKKIEPHNPTKFQIFLSVTFGAVQSLKIELDDVTKATVLPGSIAATTSSHPSTQTSTKLTLEEKTGKIKKQQKADSTGQRKIEKSEKKSNPMALILILVIAIGAAAYFFMGQDENSSSPTPEQIYE